MSDQSKSREKEGRQIMANVKSNLLDTAMKDTNYSMKS